MGNFSELEEMNENFWKMTWERCTGVSLYFVFMLNSVSNNYHAE